MVNFFKFLKSIPPIQFEVMTHEKLKCVRHNWQNSRVLQLFLTVKCSFSNWSFSCQQNDLDAKTSGTVLEIDNLGLLLLFDYHFEIKEFRKWIGLGILKTNKACTPKNRNQKRERYREWVKGLVFGTKQPMKRKIKYSLLYWF